MFTNEFNSVASPVNPLTDIYYTAKYCPRDNMTLVVLYGVHRGVDLGRLASETVPGKISSAESRVVANGLFDQAVMWAEDQRQQMIASLSA